MDGSLTDAQLQTLAIGETGTTGDANVASMVPLWWQMYSGKGQIVRFWYTKRAIYDYLLGQARRYRQVKIGNDSFNSRDVVKNLEEQRGFCQDELNGLDPQRTGTFASVDATTDLPDSFQEDVDRTNIIGAQPSIWTRP